MHLSPFHFKKKPGSEQPHCAHYSDLAPMKVCQNQRQKQPNTSARKANSLTAATANRKRYTMMQGSSIFSDTTPARSRGSKSACAQNYRQMKTLPLPLTTTATTTTPTTTTTTITTTKYHSSSYHLPSITYHLPSTIYPLPPTSY